MYKQNVFGTKHVLLVFVPKIRFRAERVPVCPEVSGRWLNRVTVRTQCTNQLALAISQMPLYFETVGITIIISTINIQIKLPVMSTNLFVSWRSRKYQ